MGVICCRKNGPRKGRGIRYGSRGGKYDDSDDEDRKGMLYNNNLLLDDDDDEEEQIVILTRDSNDAGSRAKKQQAAPVDHSVFTEGQGLLDLGQPQQQTSTPAMSPLDNVMSRLHQEQRHEDAVNEVMEEIEDQLDSDGDD